MPIRLPVESDHFRGFTRTVAATNISVEADRPLEQGLEVLLSFTLPDRAGRHSSCVRCRGAVEHSEPLCPGRWLLFIAIETVEIDSCSGTGDTVS